MPTNGCVSRKNVSTLLNARRSFRKFIVHQSRAHQKVNFRRFVHLAGNYMKLRQLYSILPVFTACEPPIVRPRRVAGFDAMTPKCNAAEKHAAKRILMFQ